MQDKIIIRGARVHNLKNVNLEIPKNKLVVFSGVSGSGKSSLAFDTIFAEGQRRYIESLSPYARQFLGQMDRPDVDEIIGLSPAIAIDQKALSHNPRSTVGTLTEILDYQRVLFARLGEVFCPNDGTKIEKLSVEEIVDIIIDRGSTQTEDNTRINAQTVSVSQRQSQRQSADKIVTILSPVVRGRKGEYYQLFYDYLNQGYDQVRIDGELHQLHDKIKLSRYKNHNIDLIIDRVMTKDETRLFEAVENAIHYSKGLVKIIFGDVSEKIRVNPRSNPRESATEANENELMLSTLWTCPNDEFSFPEVEPRLFSFNSPYGACPACHGIGKVELFSDEICPICHGKRLRPEALSVRIEGMNINDVNALTINKAYEFFVNYEAKLSKEDRVIAGNLTKEIINRLSFLLEVGLDYLKLEREAGTLSGGEAQRIRLASQIGSQLSGTLYVLDEPTIGLHERDTDKLIRTLKSLRDQKNTVIIVEHDEKTINESDYLVDLGPMAGKLGGEVVVQGTIHELTRNPKQHENSLTLQYLSHEREMYKPKDRREKTTEKIKIVGAKANNLKNVTVDIPLRKFVCLTGVSGSGKSSLLYDVLYENMLKIKNRSQDPMTNVENIYGTVYLDRVTIMDQSPIGRSPRSNPATYTGIFTPIREFFAELPDSRERGYGISRFSFNRPGGRCEACEGAGFNLIEMHFLPPVLVKCEVCQAKRFNRETLQVKYHPSNSSGQGGKNISDVLAMTVDEATDFFRDIYFISDKLKVLQEVGLGYLQLGQSATTLSGGEAQRIKLARELVHPLGKKVLYLLDEPTVGLHYHDVEMLMKVLNKLIEKGNTIMVIEHNMHVISAADHIIDLGPEGGEKGGRVIAKGTPNEIAGNTKSITGKYLKKYL